MCCAALCFINVLVILCAHEVSFCHAFVLFCFVLFCFVVLLTACFHHHFCDLFFSCRHICPIIVDSLMVNVFLIPNSFNSVCMLT